MMRTRARLLIAVVCVAGGAAVASAQTGSRLIDATKRDDAAAVRSLLSQRADVNAADADGSTALHWAAQRNNLQLVNSCSRPAPAPGRPLATTSRRSTSPPSTAAPQVIERLLDAGADANGTALEGQTIADDGGAVRARADAVRLLLTRGANVDTTEPYKGQTALMWAAAEGNTEAAAVLLEAGADIKAKSTGGFTPLLFAVRNARLDTVDLLLTRGANAERCRA